MANEYVRNLTDALKTVTKALPAANANHNTPTIDLEQVTGGIIEAIAFEVSVPATPDLVEAKAITITVQDSADDSSYAAIDPAISTTITGAAAAAGGAAKSVRFRLPPTARRYIQLNLAVAADGGDNTDVDVTFKLLA
jgi:hypothetical protein